MGGPLATSWRLGSDRRRLGKADRVPDPRGRPRVRGCAATVTGDWQGLRRLVETTSSLAPSWMVKY